MSVDDTDLDKTTSSPGKSVDKGRFRRMVWRFFYYGLICILLIAFFLPSIASRLITQPGALAWMNGKFPGNLNIGHAQLGWQSPVFLTDVSIESHTGTPLASISAVTSRSSLWKLLTGDKTSPIEFEIEGLQASLVVPEPSFAITDQSVNVGELLRPLLEKQIPVPRRDMLVTLINSQLELKTESGEILTRWSSLSGTYAFNQGQQPSHTLELNAAIEGVNAGVSKLTATAGKNSQVSKTGETLSLLIECQQQPTHALSPVLRSFLGPDQVLPEVDGSLQCVVSRNPDSISLQTTSDLHFTSTSQGQLFNTALASPDAIQMDIKAGYLAQQDALHIERLFAQTGDVMIDLTGNVKQCSGEALCSVLGKLLAPAQGITQMLPDHLREHIMMQNVQLSSLSVEGPLNPTPEAKASGINQFQVVTDLSWTHAEAFDIESDNGSIKLILKNNQAILKPNSVPVSGGNLRSLPSFDLTASPPIIKISEGIMLENVSFTQNMCRGWLKYISPTMANATSATGQLSLFTASSQFPADAIEKADIGGVLRIHQAQIGPGPLSNGILSLVMQLQTILGRNRLNNQQTWITMSNQDVTFRLVDQRVHHRDFGFMIGDMQLSSTGSVGLDDTLNLVISMELPDQWFEGKPVLANLKGEKLDIFISGTTDRPQIDSRAIAEFGKRMGFKAAGGLLDKLLNRDR